MVRAAPPSPRLVLVRHARSAHVQRGWVDAAGFRAWREAYEAAGIHADERAPAALLELARAGRVVASDAPRAVATARLLRPGGDGEIVMTPLLGELALPCPDLGRARLPLAAWALVVAGRAALEALRGQHPSGAEAARVEAAAAWLGGLAEQHGLVVAVTHGAFRRLLAARLERAGWRADPGPRSLRNWSGWGFVRRAR